jgi:hypothetical protein
MIQDVRELVIILGSGMTGLLLGLSVGIYIVMRTLK